MAITMIVTYSLKPGVERSTFAQWSRDVDVPRCRQLDACLAFDTYVATAPQAGQPDVVEVISVTSANDWDAAMQSPGHQDVLARWDELADEDSLAILHTTAVTNP